MDDGNLDVGKLKEVSNAMKTEPLSVIFPDDWMQAHTDADTIKEFLQNGPVQGTTRDEIEGFPDGWDEYVREHSDFEDWGDMHEEAFFRLGEEHGTDSPDDEA